MKPEINIALMHAAQEILTRFSPLIEDEYEQSRLNSWGALILISAMKFNQSYSSLAEENNSIINWLRKTKQIYTKDLFEEIDEIQVEEGAEQTILDEQNQLLRAILVKAHKEVDLKEDIELKKELLNLLREMHSHRKVSDLIGLLQQADS